MRIYLILSLLFSLIGHSIFFGIFKTDIKKKPSSFNPQIYLITYEQFDYLRTIELVHKDIIVSKLPNALLDKNSIWKDELDLIGYIDSKKLGIEIIEDSELMDDDKKYNFQEIQFPLIYYEYIPDPVYGIVPMFSNIFYSSLYREKMQYLGENIIRLDNDIKMIYYIQGPISYRILIPSNISKAKINIDKDEIAAKFRFWVTKDGRINQVVIEESSSYPLIDTEIVNLIKNWHFSPLNNPANPNYEWGIVSVRLQR